MSTPVPLAVVGVTWRAAPTHLRAQLAALSGRDEPLASLRAAGHLWGAVPLSTCSRTEWVVSAEHPAWAASLLSSALQSHVAGLGPQHLHVRVGAGAAHYLARVALGLDSVAEGEGAIGRQVLGAFEAAHQRGWSDRRLRAAWRVLQRLVHERRHGAGDASASGGVQSLVREVLQERRAARVAVLGRGAFGRAMERALRGLPGLRLSTFGRATLAACLADAPGLDALVVCTGASQAWLTLPEAAGAPLCIDAGSPAQVKAAPGWTTLGLDALLARPELQLSEEARAHLDALALDAAGRVGAALCAPHDEAVLAIIHEARTAFLHQQLPALLEGLPKPQARSVARAVGGFTHAILKKTRERQP